MDEDEYVFYTQGKDIMSCGMRLKSRLLEHKLQPLHQYCIDGKNNLIHFLPTKQKFIKINADIKCCLIRNPIERFISSYKNRILYHKDTKFYNHSIDMILDKLEAGFFENLHFLPQNFFLGDNLNYFQIYADIKNIQLSK